MTCPFTESKSHPRPTTLSGALSFVAADGHVPCTPPDVTPMARLTSAPVVRVPLTSGQLHQARLLFIPCVAYFTAFPQCVYCFLILRFKAAAEGCDSRPVLLCLCSIQQRAGCSRHLKHSVVTRHCDAPCVMRDLIQGEGLQSTCTRSARPHPRHSEVTPGCQQTVGPLCCFSSGLLQGNLISVSGHELEMKRNGCQACVNASCKLTLAICRLPAVAECSCVSRLRAANNNGLHLRHVTLHVSSFHQANR